MAHKPYYVEPVNLHLMTKEKVWKLCHIGDGTVAEFTDMVLAHHVADLLNHPAVEVAAAAEEGS